jgi:hypothetical protein
MILLLRDYKMERKPGSRGIKANYYFILTRAMVMDRIFQITPGRLNFEKGTPKTPFLE